jgi:hypothetical protein
MNSKDLASASTKLLVGPGGWGCACCVKFHPRKDKKVIHRIARRGERMKFRKILMEGVEVG